MLIERHHLGTRRMTRGRRVLKIQLQLALPLGVEGTEDDTQRRAALEFRGELLDCLQIGERVLAQLARNV